MQYFIREYESYSTLLNENINPSARKVEENRSFEV